MQGDEADEAERLAAGVDKAVLLVGGDEYHAARAYGGFSFSSHHRTLAGQDEYLVFPVVGMRGGGAGRLHIKDPHAEVGRPIPGGDYLALKNPRQLLGGLGIGIITYFHGGKSPLWWGRGDLNPHALRHMILNHARLPIPTLPRVAKLASDSSPEKVNQLSEKLTKKLTNSMLSDFLNSRRQGLSKHTLLFYQRCLGKAIGIELTAAGVNNFLSSLTCGNGKFAYYRAIRALCIWLHRNGHIEENPMTLVDRPHVAKKLLPSITEQQLGILLEATDTLRDTCIVSLLFDSGLRLSEMCAVKADDIDWDTNILKVVVKGNREAKAAFDPKTATLLKEYLATDGHFQGSLFGMKPGRIQNMLARLSQKVGFPCNAHSFRRGFACHLHKRGLSTISIMNLGRWSSLDMVTRYTRSITFDDCLEQYRQVNNG